MFKINDIDIAKHQLVMTPLSLQDLDSEDTGRNAQGDMIRDRITQKDKFQIELGPMTRDEAVEIIQAASAVSFMFTYFDYKLGAAKTAAFYSGDKEIEIANAHGDVSGIRFNVTEM